MKVFRVLAVAFAVSLAALTEASATTVLIDDSTDGLKMSINGVDIPNQTFPQLGTCGGGPCQVVTNNLIEPGSASSPQSAVIGWDDFSIPLPPGLATDGQFTSPILFLTEAGATPGGPPIISDEILVFIENNGGVATRIEVSLFSDFGESGFPPCPNCVSLGQETGIAQDITDAALANLSGGVPGLTIQVISDLTEQKTIPEPSTLLLLAAVGLGAVSRGLFREARP